MKPYFEGPGVTLYHGDCIEVMRTLPDESVHAVVTDPPYALSFMGRGWDTYTPLEFELWCAEWAAECFRLLKPGGHLLAFGGSRTWHRLAAGIEDAGFEVRDSIAWLYGSGFPKSLDVSKAIDKAAGAEREVVGKGRPQALKPGPSTFVGNRAERPLSDLTNPVTPEAAAWQGWGTALKPAFEPIVVARKPLVGTVAVNVLTHGTGALNIDAARVRMSEADRQRIEGMGGFGAAGYTRLKTDETFMQGTPTATASVAHDSGRWPSNVVLDESQAAELDRSTSAMRAAKPSAGNTGGRGSSGSVYGRMSTTKGLSVEGRFLDEGGAARFFPTFRYEAKAPTSERPTDGLTAHPTVKPLDLMRWLVRLVTPPNGVVLEPFAGSGTTLEAAALEGLRVIGIEREPDYLPLIINRLSKPMQQSLFGDWEESA